MRIRIQFLKSMRIRIRNTAILPEQIFLMLPVLYRYSVVSRQEAQLNLFSKLIKNHLKLWTNRKIKYW
jgi:hypothetical protein